jgi:hypothetical protein
VEGLKAVLFHSFLVHLVAVTFDAHLALGMVWAAYGFV